MSVNLRGTVAVVNGLMNDLKLDKRCDLKTIIVRYSQQLTAEFGEQIVDEYFKESFLPRLKKYIIDDDIEKDLADVSEIKKNEAIKALEEWTNEELKNGTLTISRLNGKLIKNDDDGPLRKKAKAESSSSHLYITGNETNDKNMTEEDQKFRPADVHGGWIEMEKFKKMKVYGLLNRELKKPSERLNHARRWAQENVGPLYCCDLVTYTNAQNSITLMCKAHQKKSKFPNCNLFIKCTVHSDGSDWYYFSVKKKGKNKHERLGTNSGLIDEHCTQSDTFCAENGDDKNNVHFCIPAIEGVSSLAAGTQQHTESPLSSIQQPTNVSQATQEHEIANVLVGSSPPPPPPPPLDPHQETL